ncbi:MAG: hypothetical protein OHK0029_33560 [Armatimonadaceae bacterium]
MNYLCHQHIAQQVESDGSPWFFTGNLLPDLLGGSGRRVRAGDIARVEATAAPDLALLGGMRLHFLTDRRFHSHPAFKEASAAASRLLRETPFLTPPPRVFFLAHILVEVALDGLALAENPDLAGNLYQNLEACGAAEIASTAVRLLSPSPDPERTEAIANSIQRFVRARYLEDYRSVAGQAEALYHVSQRARVDAFSDRADRALLADALHAFAPRLSVWKDALLEPPV